MNQIKRNILIVSLITVSSGWIGILLNNVSDNKIHPLESLGALVWLVTPALTGLFLRAFCGDGWEDSGFELNLSSSWKYYLLSIFIYPITAFLSFIIGHLFGFVSANGFNSKGFYAYLSSAGVIFIGSLIKNVFEELAWRGYLTSRLESAEVHPILNHLIVSILWMTWHLPYYYYFLDEKALKSAITTSIPVFIITGYLVMFPTAILFGEIRLLSKSLWPVFIMHNLINALSMPLISNGFIKLNGFMGIFFSPTNEGVFTSILFGVVGIILYQYRVEKERGYSKFS